MCWSRTSASALPSIGTTRELRAVYFLVITPIGLGIRGLGRNPPRPRQRDGSYWVPVPSRGAATLTANSEGPGVSHAGVLRQL
jgi:hypothetical protein